MYPTFAFWLSTHLAFTLWTTPTHREAPQGLSKGFCTKSLNSDIHYLTLFLMTFTFKLQFHCAVLSLQMANRPFSLHLELALRIFLAWKFNEGEKEGEFDFCQPLSFLSSWNSSPLTPFPSNLVHVHQLPVSMGLEFGLSLRCNFLVIIQKEQNNRERGREKEREILWVPSFERTNISW